jgi:peptide deformylase
MKGIMVLPIVKYGDPVLRQKGMRIEKMTPEIEKLISDMFETMHAAHGVGLAAQQIGRNLQLTVIDVTAADKDRPSTLEINGKPADVKAFMPIVLINPEIRPYGDPAKGPEGCLSFPEVYADIIRPEFVEVNAAGPKGEKISFKAGGLLARAVQHEVDHLNGILFIDRMASADKRELKPELDELAEQTRETLKKKNK